MKENKVHLTKKKKKKNTEMSKKIVYLPKIKQKCQGE